VSKNATCGRGEETKKKISCVKLAICPDHPRRHRPLKFYMCGRVREVVIYFEFYENRLRGLIAVWGRKSPSSIELAWLIQQLVLPYKPWYVARPMTASGRRSEANDVSFLWRHSSWSRSWRLERAYRRPFLTVFGEIWTPKCCRPSCGPQKGTSLCHCTSKSIHGSLNRRVWGKNNKERPYISRISPGAPLRPIGTNFGLRVRLVDVVNCAKF